MARDMARDMTQRLQEVLRLVRSEPTPSPPCRCSQRYWDSSQESGLRVSCCVNTSHCFLPHAAASMETVLHGSELVAATRPSSSILATSLQWCRWCTRCTHLHASRVTTWWWHGSSFLHGRLGRVVAALFDDVYAPTWPAYWRLSCALGCLGSWVIPMSLYGSSAASAF